MGMSEASKAMDRFLSALKPVAGAAQEAGARNREMLARVTRAESEVVGMSERVLIGWVCRKGHMGFDDAGCGSDIVGSIYAELKEGSWMRQQQFEDLVEKCVQDEAWRA
jgi:hypothetical protein